ncbi:MAG: DsbA family protein [Solirubrobacteraceae bacterium]
MSPVGSDEEDLTRKQRREQARTQRKAMEEAALASAVRRTRLTQLGIVVAVVIVAVVVILIATGGGKSASVPKSPGEVTPITTKTASLLNGIPQSANTLGSPTAPVTLQYFGDLECPICKEFTTGALPSIIPKLVRTGKLRIEYRSMSTATGNAERDGAEPSEIFKTQQVAAYAAGKQNKAWYFIEDFYNEQGEEDSGYVTEKFIQGIASQVPGLNLTQWSTDRSDAALANELTTDAQAANNQGFTGTPSFLIGKTGGTMSRLDYTNPEEPGFVEEAVEKLL